MWQVYAVNVNNVLHMYICVILIVFNVASLECIFINLHRVHLFVCTALYKYSRPRLFALN